MVAFSKPTLLRRSDMRVNWDAVSRSDVFGFHRGVYDVVEAQATLARLVICPVGQGSPRHASSAEHIHFQLVSEVEFAIADHKYIVGPQDLFFIPANLEYRYANVGLVDAVWLSIESKVSEWPPSAVYATDD